jgi:hypothetical protein
MCPMSDKPSFEDVWVRIQKRAGEAFFTKTGIRFTYRVEGEKVMLNRINYSLSKGDLMKAYPRVPMKGPSEIASLVRGTSYVWAILHDARISLKAW